jgi:hypothetical protein
MQRKRWSHCDQESARRHSRYRQFGL